MTPLKRCGSKPGRKLLLRLRREFHPKPASALAKGMASPVPRSQGNRRATTSANIGTAPATRDVGVRPPPPDVKRVARKELNRTAARTRRCRKANLLPVNESRCRSTSLKRVGGGVAMGKTTTIVNWRKRRLEGRRSAADAGDTFRRRRSSYGSGASTTISDRPPGMTPPR